MSPQAMTHAIELLVEAETILRSETSTAGDRGRALGCLTCVRAAIESSLEVAAEGGILRRALRALEPNSYASMQAARRMLESAVGE